ncbi:hypothetical protein EON66_09940 [archaeon]|nr:MAG: hypothetical protein EON66_09940 [archaeon]
MYSPCARFRTPPCVQVYTRVEALGADFGSVFRAGFGIRIVSEDAERLVFDMVGVDAPLANALRRILLSEVPSVAFEHVYLFKNTSIIQDEVLCHRIGLIPLNIDPRLMETSKRTCCGCAGAGAGCAAHTSCVRPPQILNVCACKCGSASSHRAFNVRVPCSSLPRCSGRRANRFKYSGVPLVRGG